MDAAPGAILLRGCRVLDLTDRTGWVAGRVLADLGAEVVKLEPPGSARTARWRAANAGKDVMSLDRTSAEGRRWLGLLVRVADVLIETEHPRDGPGGLLAPEKTAQLNPRLIHVSITPYGRRGPKATWLASDLELMAAGGAMSLAGEPAGEPMRISEPQAHSWAAAAAALGALVALNHRTASGRGQHVDVSGQGAVILALAHAPTFVDLLGEVPTRSGAFVTGRSVTGARFRAFWPCQDGYLNFVLYGGPAGRRTNRRLVAWMEERSADPGPLASINWDDFSPTSLTQDEVDRLEAPIASFFAGILKSEFLEEAARREILGYPVATVADIAADPQLLARGFWQELATGAGGAMEHHAGAFVRIDGTRPVLSAGREVSADEIVTRWQSSHVSPAVETSDEDVLPALANLKVVVIGAYAAGPHIGKLLANFGATVVHVESGRRPDGFRFEYPPFKDGLPGINRSGCFAYFNDSTYGVTLDLKNPAGGELARRLLDWADVVVENMRPGVMARIGLGPDQAHRTNPGLVVISTCNMGQTGPRAHTPGFGTQLSALAGFCGLTGHAAGPPMLLYGPYIDFIASTLGATAVLAAVERRSRTGLGVWIDMAQYEAGLLFMAGALLDYHSTGTVASRRGNADGEAAPHGAFRCADDRWLVLSCWSDEQVAALRAVLGKAGRSGQPSAATEDRREHAVDLEDAIATWTAGRDADSAVELLQEAGIPAAAVADVDELLADAQLTARATWRRHRHAELGDVVCYFPPFNLSLTPGEITRAAPLFGEHNEYVFGDLLGIGAAEYAAYEERGAFD